MNKKLNKMVALVGVALPLLSASASFANEVRWKNIVGVITAPDDPSTDAAENINNPVGNIPSGTFPWSVRSGQAKVDLSSGAVFFRVAGLVIIGQTFSGTPGPVTAVTGTLVCNPGEAAQAILDTPDVPIDQEGAASFKGRLQNVPATCASPLFLVRIASIQIPGVDPDAADGAWIATGTERSFHK